MITTLATTTILLASFAPLQIRGGGPPAQGLTLFQPNTVDTAYLINLDGTVEHSWTGPSVPGVAVYLDGTDLVRTLRTAASGTPGGAGGAVERVAWDGTVLWSYSMDVPNTYLQHHDVELLPNGNLLMLVWDYRSAGETVAAGREPGTVGGPYFLSERIIEVEPAGTSGGAIVWEWFAFDHLVQARDGALPNFGVVSEHPELIHINYPPGVASGDWLHFNSIDYHAEFDQILVSANHFDEVMIIDHTTTTSEAAGHTGGASGRGGDLLYRWGNPQAYERGTAADRILFRQHDAQWVEPGRPGAGDILCFNNGNGRTGGVNFSSVDEFVPDVDAEGVYTEDLVGAFGPPALSWTYQAPTPTDFYSQGISGCQRMPNGNTLVISGVQAWLFEVQPDGTLVWEYMNTSCSTLPGGGLDCRVFKARRYHDCATPAPFCVAAANTQGTGALMGWEGRASFEANDLVLVADGAIPGQPGIFYYGLNEIQLAFGNGWRCVADGVTRLSVVFCNGAGRAEYPFNLWDPGAPPGSIAIGETWKFQFWYRDPSASGPATFNLSDGLSVLFCP